MPSLNLYFIRHGIAADPTEFATDAERPLTADGTQKTQKVAQRLQELGLHFDLILTSPLVRAEQTANLLSAVGLSKHLELSDDLAPTGQLQTWLQWLENWRKDSKKRTLALVGHQPNLGEWAETLVWGKSGNALVVKKAGVMGLTLPETGSPIGRSELFWLTPPKFLL